MERLYRYLLAGSVRLVLVDTPNRLRYTDEQSVSLNESILDWIDVESVGDSTARPLRSIKYGTLGVRCHVRRTVCV